MRTRIGTILIAVVALVVGVAAGWFAGRASTPNVPDAKVSAPRASEQSTRTSGVGAHRPAANVVDKPRHAAVKIVAEAVGYTFEICKDGTVVVFKGSRRGSDG